MSDIVIKDLTVRYGDKTVFDKFSATFEEGKINVVLGGSGVGKTTLLNAIAGLIPFEGSTGVGERRMSYIFQNDRLVPSLSVYKNLELVLKASVKDRKERKRRIEETLSILEIANESKKLPSQISGGQAQRVAMARAYLFDADILLMDEPFKTLDISLKSRLIKQLIELNLRAPRTVIFVTHAIDECLLTADNYFVLSSSPASICASGTISSDKSGRSLVDKDLAVVRAELLEALV